MKYYAKLRSGFGPLQSPAQAFSPELASRPRVVLADDDSDMRKYIERLLHNRFNVVSFCNGAEALKATHEEPTDLLITDIMMPEIGGQELLKLLKLNPETSRIPVIILSARADQEARLRSIEAGADDYILKPFNASELMARAQSLITSSRIKRETESRLYELFMQMPASIAVLRRL